MLLNHFIRVKRQSNGRNRDHQKNDIDTSMGQGVILGMAWSSHTMSQNQQANDVASGLGNATINCVPPKESQQPYTNPTAE